MKNKYSFLSENYIRTLYNKRHKKHKIVLLIRCSILTLLKKAASFSIYSL